MPNPPGLTRTTPKSEAGSSTSASVEGRVAVVTGAGRGIGRAVAELLAAEGAHVVVNDLGAPIDGTSPDPRVADDVARAIVARGGSAVANYDSVVSMAGAERIINTAVHRFGQIDILVNNAGIARPASFLEMTEDEWDEVIAVHLRGAFLCTQVASKQMAIRRYGRVINMSSRSAFGRGSRGGVGRRANYSSAKAGILGLTWALSHELAPLGITCNAVLPSAETRLTAVRVAGDARSAAEAVSSTPEDVAPLIVFLASANADSINGRTFYCTRGRVELYSDPKPVRTVLRGGQWTVDVCGDAVVQLLADLD